MVGFRVRVPRREGRLELGLWLWCRPSSALVTSALACNYYCVTSIVTVSTTKI